MDTLVIIFRMLLTFILAMVFGLQRQRTHKPIGFGTFTFVAIGSCGLAVTAIIIGMGNPLPLLGAIVTGIGFLGAGALIKTNDKIYGFTTAASIWVFSIFGLVIGVGEYLVGGIVYLSIWTIILVDGFFKKNGIGSYQKRIFFEIKNKNMNDFNELLKNFKRIKMITIESNKRDKTEKLEYLVECDGKKLRKVINLINELKWVVSYKVE
ncbi:MAG: MgtC/SapB family protein [Nanoarchaeota archaeon]|nr:MgtC/SapB family protein [Nanoarchaeota archaeon]